MSDPTIAARFVATNAWKDCAVKSPCGNYWIGRYQCYYGGQVEEYFGNYVMLDRDGKVITSDKFEPYYIIHHNRHAVCVYKVQAKSFDKYRTLHAKSLGRGGCATIWEGHCGAYYSTVRNLYQLHNYAKQSFVVE